MEREFERYFPDMEAFHRGMRTGPCFLCEIAAGTNELPQHFVYEDEEIIAFLDGYPRACGYTLVAPRSHREQVTDNFTLDEYLGLQRVVYRVTKAVREEVSAERMYIYTFGSNQGGAHVHRHVVPLPHGVLYEEQRGAWASWGKGVLDIPQQEMFDLAGRIGRRM